MFGFLAPLTWATVVLSLTSQSTASPLGSNWIHPRAANASCKNSPTTRSCWDGTYNIDTDWYASEPDTGVIREYNFNIQNLTLSPDGFETGVLGINGQSPGPTIVADWGDTIVVHVTNQLTTNGTTIHWHGMRQAGNNAMDGVSSVTQCPIAPGQTYTYSFKADSYGTTWYHSHLGLQAWDGVHGAIIINGPATANYDEDFGTLVLTDWQHQSASSLLDYAALNGPPPQISGLINGTNNWQGLGKWFEGTVEEGKKYRFRLINTANDATFKFGIDGHKITVIAADLVPVTPYETDYVTINNGQRYDLIIEANNPLNVSEYWIRSIPQVTCSNYKTITDITNLIKGVLRYTSNSTTQASTADPTTTALAYTDDCTGEEPNLHPYIAKNVGIETFEDNMNATVSAADPITGLHYWQINDVHLVAQWSEPTLKLIADGDDKWSNTSNVVEVPNAGEWIYIVIEQTSGAWHPIHLHGHDFFVLASGTGTYQPGIPLNTINPPRRDTTIMPGKGFLVIAFYTDNPGVWLMHCHIGNHAATGFAVQFVEQLSAFEAGVPDEVAAANMDANCKAWDDYAAAHDIVQDDSGI